MTGRIRVGRHGEDLAAAHLRAAGWTVLERNWRCAAGELDLVARDGDRVVAVEVKTRRSQTFGTPAEAVTPVKVARLRRLLARWLVEHDEHAAEVRVDVVAVVLRPGAAPHVEHLVGVA